MHHKKFDLQIGKESSSTSSVSSDFVFPSNSPNALPQSPPYIQIQIPESQCNSPKPIPRRHERSSNTTTFFSSTAIPHKRLLMNPNPNPKDHRPSLSHSQALTSLRSNSISSSSSASSPPKSASSAFRILRRIRLHLRLLLLLSLPSFYYFLANPHRSFLLDLVSVIALSAAVVVSISFALPRLPSIYLLLRRSFPVKFSSSTRPSTPVLWFIGSKHDSENRPASGSWVEVYSNGDVYEGEFHRGKCSGSGVYCYYMSGRYEGDWVDGKYDGYGVETWARGSRYRGQYRQGLRHGYGVYRFYTGDVYAGEWLNGQSHGRGVHACEDGSRYVGEFKWGVKHGLGHYQFR